jgi:hypothetical protein
VDRSRAGLKDISARIMRAVDQNPHASALDGMEREIVASVRAASRRLHDVVGVVPWEWVPSDWLDAASEAFDPIVRAIENHVGDEAGHLALSWSNATAAWAAVANFLPAVPGAAHENLAEEVSAYRSSVAKLVDEVRESIKTEHAHVAEVGERAGAVGAEYERFIERVQVREQNFEATIAEQSARLEAAIRENQAQFSQAQEMNRERFAQVLDEARQQLEADSDAMRTKSESRAAQYNDAAKNSLKHLKQLEVLATRTYQVVSNATTAGFFQNEANDQKQAANTWRLVGVSALVLIVVLGAFELFLGDATPSLEHSAARLPIALAGAALATYCLRESGQHRRQERLLRRREVDVSTIAPYLESIVDQDERERLKVAHAKFLFLTPDTTPQEDPDGFIAESPQPD